MRASGPSEPPVVSKELDVIIKANYLCDEPCLDTISMGSTITYAMELVQRKKIKPERLQG